MISFRQLESGTPPDIEVTTDDADAEMAAMQDELHEWFPADSEMRRQFDAAQPNAEGKFVFVMPAAEAAELADSYMPLATFIEECNDKAIAAAEKAAESH